MIPHACGGGIESMERVGPTGGFMKRKTRLRANPPLAEDKT